MRLTTQWRAAFRVMSDLEGDPEIPVSESLEFVSVLLGGVQTRTVCLTFILAVICFGMQRSELRSTDFLQNYFESNNLAVANKCNKRQLLAIPVS